MLKVNSANAPYTSPFLPLWSPLFPDGVSLGKPYFTRRFTTMHHEQWYCTGIVTIVMMHSVDSFPLPAVLWADLNPRFTSCSLSFSQFFHYCDCQMWHSSSVVSLHLRVFSTASPLNVRTCLRKMLAPRTTFILITTTIILRCKPSKSTVLRYHHQMTLLSFSLVFRIPWTAASQMLDMRRLDSQGWQLPYVDHQSRFVAIQSKMQDDLVAWWRSR